MTAIGVKERVAVPRDVLERHGQEELPPVVIELPGEALKSGSTLKVKGPGVDGPVTVVSPTLHTVSGGFRGSTAGMTSVRRTIESV